MFVVCFREGSQNNATPCVLIPLACTVLCVESVSICRSSVSAWLFEVMGRNSVSSGYVVLRWFMYCSVCFSSMFSSIGKWFLISVPRICSSRGMSSVIHVGLCSDRMYAPTQVQVPDAVIACSRSGDTRMWSIVVC